MMPRSIRSQLPLTYAALVLITVLTLGGSLLAILHGYYTHLEERYLVSAGESLAPSVQMWLVNDFPMDGIKQQLDSEAYFSQVRVTLLDADRQMIYDSGPPYKISLAELIYGMDVLDAEETSSGQDTTDGTGDEMYTVLPTSLESDAVISVWDVPPSDEYDIRVTLYSVSNIEGTFSEGGTVVFQGVTQVDELTTPVDLLLGTSGIGMEETGPPKHRSGCKEEYPLIAPDGHPLGYLQFSEGPAFGGTVIRRVSVAWAFSSLLAMVLAVFIGWRISWRISRPVVHLAEAADRMSQGDLSVRAYVRSSEELNRLAASFNSMAEQIEQTISTLKRFVADAAHELHTPLTSMLTNLELVISHRNTTPRQTDLTQRAIEQIHRMERLTNQLLELSRLESASQPVRLGAVNLATLIQASSTTYASWSEQKGVDFTLELRDSDLAVWADAHQLKTVIHNLLENAIKFTPEGGTIHATLRRCEDGTCAVFAVQDTGIGIPLQDMPFLFERFHRGRNALGYAGSGLGLAIVQTVVERLGGSVRAQNVTPHGTCFEVRLPLWSQKNRVGASLH